MKLLAFFIVISSAAVANALPPTQIHPLAECEAALNPEWASYGTRIQDVYKLIVILNRLQRKEKERGLVDEELKKLSAFTRHLSDWNSTRQFYAISVRGEENIQNARLAYLNAIEALIPVYENIDDQIKNNPELSSRQKKAVFMDRAILAAVNALPVAMYARGNASWMAFAPLAIFYDLARIHFHIYFQSESQTDLRILPALQDVEAMRDKPIVLSTTVMPPFEFPLAIYKEPHRNLDSIRAFAYLKTSTIPNFFVFNNVSRANAPRRIAQLGGIQNLWEAEWAITLDHVLYFDQDAQEPVWLMVYRAGPNYVLARWASAPRPN